MFKVTVRLYDKARMLTEHMALGETVPLATQAAIRRLLDDFSIDWHSIEIVMTGWRNSPFVLPTIGDP